MMRAAGLSGLIDIGHHLKACLTVDLVWDGFIFKIFIIEKYIKIIIFFKKIIFDINILKQSILLKY
jgi:hypothetical protein